MNNASKNVLDATIYLLSIPVLIMLHITCGWMSGWIVGLVFGDTILDILGQIGIHNITTSQYGAFLGFTSGFLRTRTEVKIKKDE